MPTTLMTGVWPAIGVGAGFDIQPAVGMGYCVTDFASDQMDAGGVPDIEVYFRDGLLADAVMLLDPATELQKEFRPKELYIDNVTYLHVINRALAGAVIGVIGHQVRGDIIRSLILVAPNGGTVDFMPPLGEVWRCTEIGAALANATNEIDATVTFNNGLVADPMICDGARDSVWSKLLNWYISNALYLTVAPIAAADNAIGLSAILVDETLFGAIVAVGAAATVAIIPPEGIEAVVTEVGSSRWAGAAAAGNPDQRLELTDGVTPAILMDAGSVRDSLIRNRKMGIEIDNTIYLQIVDVGAGANYGYCGYIKRQEHTT